MAIQVRRGNEADFDANKMLPGEWAVSLDTKYVRMCFAPGVVLRMASYEAFESDMEVIQSILEECEEIQTAIERIKSEIDEKASLTIEYSNSASLSATRASEEADRAHEEAERAKNYADSAQSATNVQIATKDTAGIIKGGDNYITEDGTLQLITETTETTMPNSYDGRLKVDEIGGKCVQGENPSPTNPQEIKSVEVWEIKSTDDNGNESTVTLSSPITLMGIGDVQDVIEDGKVKRRIGMVHVSGDWAWNKHGGAVGNNSYYTFQSFGQANMPDGENGVFTHFSTGILNENHRGLVGVNTVQIRFDEISSIDELKAWLNSNEVYAYFLLDGEVVEDLPIADQIALNSLSTYDGITYLEFDSEIEPTFKGEYGTSKVGGYTLEGMLAGRNGELYGKNYVDRITALEATVVNNI